MKITIAAVTAAIIMRFTVPGPGRYYLFETDDYEMAWVIASNNVTNACHVSVKLPSNGSHRIYWVEFTASK